MEIFPTGAVAMLGVVAESGASHRTVRLWTSAIRPRAEYGISRKSEWDICGASGTTR